MAKYVVFDFDGTIADTFTVVEEIAHQMLAKYAITMDSHEAKTLGLQGAILKSKFPKWKIPEALQELRQKINLRIKENVTLFPEMGEVLRELSKNYRLGIVSSNSGENIAAFLANNGISELFTFIYSDSSLFGKHVVLKRLCKKYGIDYSNIVYVGDEDRDIQAAGKLGIKVIAVTWGYNFEELLRKENPDFLIESPSQILPILNT